MLESFYPMVPPFPVIQQNERIAMMLGWLAHVGRSTETIHFLNAWRTLVESQAHGQIEICKCYTWIPAVGQRYG